MSFLAHESIKTAFGRVVSSFVECVYPTSTIYLETGPVDLELRTEAALTQRFNQLGQEQKNQVYGKVWELAKMLDPRIHGANWGEEHALEDSERLAKALHKLGLLTINNLHPLKCLPFGVGEGGLGSQYFSLSEKLGEDPASGQISYINGMGIPTLEHAGRDVADFSDRFASGNNIHSVYHSTHQNAPSGDLIGFFADIIRMKAVDGGSYTKTSYLAAQQCVDFLDANPEAKYLQIGVSEGGAHVNAALRLIRESRPDLLSRIRVLNFCPAYFILPDGYPEGFQVVNLVKVEDSVVNPWATNTHAIGHSDNIKIVPHNNDNPHNHLCDDFAAVGKPFVDEFIRSGNLY